MTQTQDNRVLKHLGCRYPIIQAPMGWIARSPLASAVSNAGGFGIIETSSGELENCRAEIAKMPSLTDKPFGINLPLLFIKDPGIIDMVINSGVKFVTTSAGDPSKYIDALKGGGLTVYHAVPNLAGAMKAAHAGVDGLVVEGTEGGGFKNPEEIGLHVLIQAIQRKIDLPIIAAGGIVDGVGMAAAFASGAEAVQMGTRFVSSQESPVHANYKSSITGADLTDTWILNKKGRPCVRALKTEFTRDIHEAGLMEMSAMKNIKDLYFGGNMNAAPALAGQSVGLINEVKSVADIIQSTISEFNASCQKMGQLKF